MSTEIKTGKQLDDVISRIVDLTLSEQASEIASEVENALGVKLNDRYIVSLVMVLTSRARTSLRNYLESQIMEQGNFSTKVVLEYADTIVRREGR